VKYLAAFTCAILNNQPMGFYSPAVLIEDARRHGLRVKPIDIQVSEWACTLEREPDYSLSLRLGLGYAKGLRQEAAEAIVASREVRRFCSIEDLALRVDLKLRGVIDDHAGIAKLQNTPLCAQSHLCIELCLAKIQSGRKISLISNPGIVRGEVFDWDRHSEITGSDEK
jgi:Helix-hairpin-helix motif